MCIRISRRSYKSYSYTELILITDVYVFGSQVGVYETYAYIEVPLGTTKLILILWSSHLFGGTRRYYGDITKHIMVLRNLPLYGSTRKYYKTYTGTSYLILVLRSVSWSYGTYTCITELILVFWIFVLYFKSYTELILI